MEAIYVYCNQYPKTKGRAGVTCGTDCSVTISEFDNGSSGSGALSTMWQCFKWYFPTAWYEYESWFLTRHIIGVKMNIFQREQMRLKWVPRLVAKGYVSTFTRYGNGAATSIIAVEKWPKRTSRNDAIS